MDKKLESIVEDNLFALVAGVLGNNPRAYRVTTDLMEPIVQRLKYELATRNMRLEQPHTD